MSAVPGPPKSHGASKSAPPAAEVFPWEEIGAAPWIKEAPSSPAFEAFCEKILPKLTLSPTGTAVMEAFGGMDVKAGDVASILARNPYYEAQFRRVIQSISKREDIPSVESAIVLLGMQRSRDLVLALQMHRTVTGDHPPWSEDGKLQIDPKVLLVYTAKTEDPLAGNKENYSASAFMGGAIFDWAVRIAEAEAADLKSFKAFADGIFAHGVRTARVAAALLKLVPDVGLTKRIFAAAIAHDIGKVLMAIVAQDYPEFHTRCAAAGLARSLRIFAERQRFGVSHEIIGALACEVFKPLSPVSRAVLFHHEPQALKRESKALFLLAGLLAFSSNVATHFRKSEKPGDPLHSLWKSRELKEFPLDPKKAEPEILKLIQSGA